MVSLAWRKIQWLGFGLSFGLLIGSGCSASPTETAAESEVQMKIQVTSSAFTEGGDIPVKYTCDAENISPQLAWSPIPGGTQNLALIMDDPDAPVGTWVHWVLYNLSPDINELSEGVQGVGVVGKNSWGKAEYGGPCPPPGKPHRYFFKLYALDTELSLQPGATKEDVENAMQGHILAQGQLMGNYGR